MKHKPLIPLITLLKILNNRFEPEEQRRLQIKVRKDSVSLARLQQLRNAVGSTTTLNLNEKSIASTCLLYTSPSPRDRTRSRMPSSA